MYDTSMLDFKEYFELHSTILRNFQGEQNILNLVNDIENLAQYPDSLIFTVGNGGSASTAEHFSADLSLMEQRTGTQVRSICLNSSVALNSALSNDISYETALVNQINLYNKFDYLLVTFSASGNSLNILQTIELALANKKKVYSFVGFDAGAMKDIKLLNLIHYYDPLKNYGIAENLQLSATHYVIELLVKRFRT